MFNHDLRHIGYRLRRVVMPIHFLNEIRNLRHRHPLQEHVNDEGLQRVIGSLVRSNRLLFKLPFAIPGNGEL
jgi:hypothetical protein